MRTYSKFALLAVVAVLMYMTELSPRFPSQGLEMVKEAQAVFGVRRRTARRSVAVGYTMGAASAKQQAAAQQQAATAQQQSATAQQQSATAQQQSATAQQQSATAQQQAQAAGAPPIGSIVAALPAGCVTTAKGGVQYFNCNGVFYRAAFQGNNLVYVVTQP